MKKTPLKRYTPLKRITKLQSHTPLKATKGLNKVSAKTDEKNKQWRDTETYCLEHYSKGLCEIRATDECKARNFKPDWRGLSGHHIIPRSSGRIDTEDNCILGCGDCHNHQKYGKGTPLSIPELQAIVARRGKITELSKTSLLYWWSKIQGLGIPLPKTEIVEIPYNHLVSLLDDKSLPKKYLEKVIEAGDKIGYPLFLRTDMASAKHSWEKTCFVPEKKDLLRHIWALIDTTLAMGMFGELDPNALVFREFLYLEDSFLAFANMPVAKERRYFIKDGEVQCHHPYWIQDAIEQDWRPNKPANWRELLAKLNSEGDTEVRLLTYYSGQIARVLTGYWSVDYAKKLAGTWYLIDMAEGEKSWHPNHITTQEPN